MTLLLYSCRVLILYLFVHLSLSRLNHGQPGVQAHPEIVQGTAELHHEIADTLLPQADPVFHNPTTLDATVDMLDPEPPLMEYLVGQVLLQSQFPTAGLLRRHEDLHLGERERQEAQILQQPTPSRELIRGGFLTCDIASRLAAYCGMRNNPQPQGGKLCFARPVSTNGFVLSQHICPS